MKYRHLFFDLDRTLWDFETNSARTLEEIFSHFKLAEKAGVGSEDFIHTYRRINHLMWEDYRKGKITKAILRSGRFYRTLNQYGINDLQLADQIGEYYVNYSPVKTALIPHALEVLTYLNEKYHLHVITNGFQEVQHIKLMNCQLSPFFKTVITSEQAGCKKPEAAIFTYALNQAGANLQESLMIGDDLNTDIAGAKNVGMDQVYYNPGNHSHSESVTYEIKCLTELKKFL